MDKYNNIITNRFKFAIIVCKNCQKTYLKLNYTLIYLGSALDVFGNLF